MIKIIIVKLLKFFKVFEKNRKLNFEIIFMLRSICLHFYNLFLFNKSLVNYLNVSGSDKGIKYIRMYDILPSLIEKKNPLVVPPDFDQLPIPEGNINSTKASAENDGNFEQLLKKENKSDTIATDNSGSTTEESILKKIKIK